MTKRIEKLCAVKERAAFAAERSLAQARATVSAAEMALLAIEQTWRDALERNSSAMIMADLDDADARARTLRQAVQRAEANVAARKVEVERQEGLVAEARTELRRFEKWGERADATAKATMQRIARGAEDALAARNTREA